MRKTLAIIMMIAMVFCYMPLTGFADTEVSTTSVNTSGFIDMPNNWSTEALSKAVGNGLLEGFKEKSGTFIKPSDPLTRAQMATIVNRAFGAKGTANLTGVKDVPQKAWYTAEMQKAVKMGTMKLDSKMRPNDPITRQEAFTVLARAFKMADGTMANLEKFSDKEKVSSWAVSSLGALARVGYIQGADGKLNPLSKITRAEFAVVMDNMIKEYINKAGTVTQVHEGNLMINVPDVILKDITVKGDLILGDGIGEGNVTLENVIVKGNLIARGGGVNSIIIVGGGVDGKIVIAKVDGQVRVSVEGGAEVEVIVIDDGKDDVIIEGTVGTVEVTAPDTPVIVQNATVTNIEIKSVGAANVTVDSGSTVTNVVVGTGSTGTTLNVEGRVTNVETSAANTNVGGTGTVTTVTTNEGANNTSVTTPSTKVNNDGATGVTAGGGTEVPSGSTATNSNTGGEATVVTTPTGGGSTGSGSGSGDTVVNVSAISVDQTTLTLTAGGATGTITATVLPVDATNKTVTWTSSNETVATVAEGVITPLTVGTTTITATTVDGSFTATTLVTVEAAAVDKTALTAAINAEYSDGASRTTYALTEADYTGATWTAYTTAITNAIAVEADGTANQTEVNAAAAAIGTAEGNLVFAGQADLDTAVAAAGALTEADYTVASWADLTAALALPETTNAEVVAKTTAINNAISGLVAAVDKTALTAAINAEYSDGASRTTYALTEADYTGATWTAYTTAITNAIAVEADGTANQTEVNAAAAAIGTAEGNLVFAGQADLDAAKGTAAGLTEGDYTVGSWADLTTALALPETTNAEVVAKITAINNAISGLVAAVDKTALTAAIAAANTNKDSVTVSTNGTDIPTTNQWVTAAVMTDYTTAIATAQGVADDGTADQATVDAAVTTLATATATFDGAKAAGTLTSDTVINIAAIAGVTFPVNGATPVTTITETAQYTGTVSWATVGGEPVLTEGKFAASTYYIATITLTPKAGFTLTGVSANFFTVAGGAATNAANAGVVTANFPATAPDVEIATAAIVGVTAPVNGATPVDTIAATDEYTAAIAWSPADATFGASTVYTATITLTPKAGYTVTGVAENFFTVAGATATNAADSGVVTAIFPATKADGPAAIAENFAGAFPADGTSINLIGLAASATGLEAAVAIDGTTYGEYVDLTVDGSGIAAITGLTGVTSSTKVKVRVAATETNMAGAEKEISTPTTLPAVKQGTLTKDARPAAYQLYTVQVDSQPVDTLVYRMKPDGTVNELEIVPDSDNRLNIYQRVSDTVNPWTQQEGEHTFLIRKGDVWYESVIDYDEDEFLLERFNASQLRRTTDNKAMDLLQSMLVGEFDLDAEGDRLTEIVSIFWFDNYHYQNKFTFASTDAVRTALAAAVAERDKIIQTFQGTGGYATNAAAVESYLSSALRLAKTSTGYNSSTWLAQEIEELAGLSANVVAGEAGATISDPLKSAVNDIEDDTAITTLLGFFGRLSQ